MGIIGKHINTAIMHLMNKDYEMALSNISMAIDSTARKKWPSLALGEPGEVKKRICNFVDDYQSFIYEVASGGAVILGNVKIQYEIKNQVKSESDLVNIICRSSRHGFELGEGFIFVDNSYIGFDHDKNKPIIGIPYIYGLLFSVIVDPINNMERCELNPILPYNEKNFIINELWGDAKKYNDNY